MRKHDIIERKEQEYSTRRIQFCFDYFRWTMFGKLFKKTSKIKFSKIVKADLNSPHRELSNGGLDILVALFVFWELIFCASLLWVQSSCSQ